MEAIVDSIKASRMRWVMISMAFLATVLNYIHRLSFNYLSADGELRNLIPNEAFGYIGTAFFVAYMISNAFSGYVIDKLGTRLGYALCMAFWTTAGLFHAFVITPIQFGIVRFFLGIGEAGNWPAALKLTAEWFPPHERSTASGIFNSGSALGAIIVPPLVAYLALSYSWQTTFILLAALGYLWLAAFWFIYYTPKQVVPETKAKQIPYKQLLKTRFVRTFILSKFFLDPVWYFITFWVGRYLVDVHHLSLKQIGWLAVIPFIIADVGNLIGGYFTQFIIKRGMPIPQARKLSVCLSAGIMAAAFLAAPFLVTSPLSALLLFGMAGFGYTSYTANSLACPADVVPKSSAATVWGIGCVGTGLGGALFQSLSGIMLGKFNTTNILTGYNYLFMMYGAIAVIGMLVVWFLMGPIRKNENLHAIANNNDVPTT
jgi:ACS family hexuronate transporter-like MFS transporter